MKNIVAFVIVSILLISFCNKCAENPPQSTEPAPKPLTEQEIKTHVIKLEKEFSRVKKNVRKFEKQFDKFVTAYYSYGCSIFELYEVTEIAKGVCDDANKQLGAFPLYVDGLPKNVQDKLSTCRSNITTGYYTKAEAYTKIMEFLDNGKLSMTSQIKKEFTLGNGLIYQGEQQFEEVKTLCGITKKKK